MLEREGGGSGMLGRAEGAPGGTGRELGRAGGAGGGSALPRCDGVGGGRFGVIPSNVFCRPGGGGTGPRCEGTAPGSVGPLEAGPPEAGFFFASPSKTSKSEPPLFSAMTGILLAIYRVDAGAPAKRWRIYSVDCVRFATAT